MSGHSTERGGMGVVSIVCAAIGIATVAGTLALGSRFLPSPDKAAADKGDEEYGKRLIAHTTEFLGPDVADVRMRFTDSRLACGSCHIDAGAEPGALSLVAAITHYPRISARSGAKETIEDRINGCMVRSMNGRPLPLESLEMRSMVSWLRFLAERDAAMGASQREAHDPAAFKAPLDRAANLEAGERLYGKRCADCHGKNGAGLPAARNPVQGYLFPPLWGANSFNDGAGLHRVLTASQFIKAKMPLGRADLSDDEAFDVAAFVNSKPRPEMRGLERDYPDRAKKPVDTGYPPYADSFSVEQHRFGPFGPINAYYRGMKKVSR
jgi:thiosulfate dehydrogenase